MISLLQILEKLDKKAYNPIVVLCHDYDCADEFSRIGCKLVTLHQNSSYFPTRNRKQNSFIRTLKRTPFTLFLKEVHTLFKRRKLILGLFKIIRNHEVDLVHCNSKYEWAVEGILPAYLLRKPCICHTRSYLETTSLAFGIIEKMTSRHIAISNSIRVDLIDHGIDDQKISLIPNWINIDKSRQGNLPITTYSSSDIFKILSVGRIISWKGLHILIEAARVLVEEKKRVSVYIYGEYDPEGEYYRQLVDMVSQKGLKSNVKFMGYAKKEEIYSSDYHLSVHAATSPEPFGRVIIEAMYRQIPVIASRLGGVTDIIQDGKNGLMFEPGAPEDLAGKIRKLIDEESYRQRLAICGRRSVIENFSEEGRLEHLSQIYDEVLNQKH